MSIGELIAQYEAAKDAMLEGYRGMHKAPHFTTWNEVQDLQDKMQSAAVELAEHMLTALSTPVSRLEDEAHQRQISALPSREEIEWEMRESPDDFMAEIRRFAESEGE